MRKRTMVKGAASEESPASGGFSEAAAVPREYVSW